MTNLPRGWAETTIGEVVEPFVSIDPTKQPDTEFRYVDIGSIDKSTQTIGEPKTFLGRDAPSRARRVIHEGDVLFSTVRTYLKNIAAVPGELDGALTSTGIAVLRASGAVDPRYLFNWVCSDEFVGKMSGAQDGTLYPAVTDKDVSGASIPLPPLPEQRRIVAKVDGLTARTARARKELDRIPTLIARYKSVVLALAFSGRLTQDWRIEMSRGALGAGEYPEGWAVKELGQISEIQGGIQVGKKRPASAELLKVPYLRVANVQRGWLNLEEIKTLEVTAAERDRLLLADGDILMNEGGDRDKLGRGWVWRAQVPVCIHQNHVFRIRLNDPDFPPEYVSHYANENGQQYFIDQGTQTTNLASISKRKVAALPVPIPPADEAAEIVRRIESVFGWLDRMAADHAAAARLLPKLDAAILAKAFRGELVPQDPSDEPASSLLERVGAKQAERAASRLSKKTKTKKDDAMVAKPVSTRNQLLDDCKDWPASGLTYEDLAKRVARPYDDMREALFELLAEAKPQIVQAFDPDRETMVLRRAAA